jgi:ADYC domain
MGYSRCVATALFLMLAGMPAAAQMGAVSVTADGTQFVVIFADGRVLRSPQLSGAVLTVSLDGKPARLRVEAVAPDPGDPAHGVPASPEVWLHHFVIAQPDGNWSELCETGPDGRRDAFPLEGRARPDGAIEPAAPGDFVLTCTGGAEGKWVRFGYHPWKTLPDGRPMLPVYNACVHLVRADYAGDGRATTRNGQPIDIYDAFGIEKPGDDPHYTFEAGWTAAGAVCVNHVRVRENASLDGLAETVPRLAGRLGDICTEDFARAAGAILFVRSPQ